MPFQRHHRVARSDATDLTLSHTTTKRSNIFDSERLHDSKHTTYYLFKTLFTFISVLFFCYLYFNSPNHALGEFKYNSEHQQQREESVQLETPLLTQYHGRIVRIFLGFLAQLVISLSLLTMGFCKSRGTITNKNSLFVILFLLLAGFTMWTFIEHSLFILSNYIGSEITKLLQDGLPSALHLLQEKNKCCRIIMMNKQQSPASGCRHVFDVPNCTEMFIEAVSHQQKVLWMVFLIHPIIFIIFLYSNFTKRPDPTPLKSLSNAGAEAAEIAVQNGDDQEETELHNVPNESTPLIEPVKAVTKISQRGNRADTILSQEEGDPLSEHRFHSDNSELSHRRPNEMPREEKFHSAPLSNQDTKKNK